MKKKSGWIFSVVIISFALLIGGGALDAFAFGKSGVITNAEKLFDIGNYEMASESLADAIKKGEVPEKEWADAYKLLGDIYQKMGRNSDAKKAYRYAVITEGTGYRDEQLLLYLDVKNLEAIFPKLMENAKNNEKLQANYGADIAQLAKNELIAGRIDNAEDLYNLSLKIDPKNRERVKDAFELFFELGKQKKGKEAEKYADTALRFASNKEADIKVGKLLLRSAIDIWPDKDYLAIKKKAVTLAGAELVNKVFAVKSTVVFTKNFTERDADKKGHISIFTWKNMTKKGDLLRVKAKIKGDENNLDEVGLHLGNSQWYIKNGVIEKVVDNTLPYQSYTNCVIAINLNKQIVLTVEVVREIETPNNINLNI